MPQLPLDSPQARYVLTLVKVHLPKAPSEADVTVEMDDLGRLCVRQGSTSWCADGDGVAEATIGDDGRVVNGRWRFGTFSPSRHGRTG